MQIFLTSHTRSFSGKKHTVYAQGFSLPELLVSIAIIGIISTIVLVKYSAFDSTVIAKSAAYEVALALREAQVKSVSVARSDDNFDNPFGIHLTKGESVFQTFVFKDPDFGEFAQYDSAKAEKILDTQLERGMTIGEICIRNTNSGGGECDIETLDISFRRPEFKAIFYATEPGAPDDIEHLPSTIPKAYIRINSPTGANNFEIEVTQLGQISVQKP